MSKNYVIHQKTLNGEPFRSRISEHGALSDAKNEARRLHRENGERYAVKLEKYAGNGWTAGFLSSDTVYVID